MNSNLVRVVPGLPGLLDLPYSVPLCSCRVNVSENFRSSLVQQPSRVSK